MQHAIGVGIKDRITFDLFITGQSNHTSVAGGYFVCALTAKRWHVWAWNELQGLNRWFLKLG